VCLDSGKKNISERKGSRKEKKIAREEWLRPASPSEVRGGAERGWGGNLTGKASRQERLHQGGANGKSQEVPGRVFFLGCLEHGYETTGLGSEG